MFEDICLNCGKHLNDDCTLYCSDECQNDAISPSISSASSALSSPHLDYAVGGEVPSLVPSALGYALKDYQHKSVHSSSTSSASWSVATDDEDDEAMVGFASDRDPTDSVWDPTSKSPSSFHFMNHLAYARRPSATNNRSTIAHLHKRTSSGSFTGHVRTGPPSAPFQSPSSTEDEGFQSDCALSSQPEHSSAIERSFTPGQSAPGESLKFDGNSPRHSTITSTKTKRSRNRASLPAYFSLLQMPSSSHSIKVSPPSGQTIGLSRPSPPTPKLSLAGINTKLPLSSVTAPPTAISHHTPRGRRRDIVDAVVDFQRTRAGVNQAEDSSRSNSRTRERQTTLTDKLPPTFGIDDSTNIIPRSRLTSRSSAEQVFDWSSVPGLPLPPRGRAAVRRNSSPPPKVIMSMRGLGLGYERSVSPARNGLRAASSGHRRRGRARVEDLDGIGVGCTAGAPGYGHGRSGLLDREGRRPGRYPRS